MTERVNVKGRKNPAMDKAKPIELLRHEALTLVFERLMNIRNAVDECEDRGVDNPQVTNGADYLRRKLREIDRDAKRALEIIETLPGLEGE